LDIFIIVLNSLLLFHSQIFSVAMLKQKSQSYYKQTTDTVLHRNN